MQKYIKPLLLLACVALTGLGVKSYLASPVDNTVATPAQAVAASENPLAPTPAVNTTTVLPDLAELKIGNENAPNKIIVYKSLTCSHCAHFQTTVLPELKKNYIDTGKVQYIFRDFPLDEVALSAAMLARCAGAEKREAFIAMLFEKQQEWLTGNDMDAIKQRLLPYGRIAALSDEQMKSCLVNDAIKAAVVNDRTSGEIFKVDGTPTVIVNGTKLTSAPTFENIKSALDKKW